VDEGREGQHKSKRGTVDGGWTTHLAYSQTFLVVTSEENESTPRSSTPASSCPCYHSTRMPSIDLRVQTESGPVQGFADTYPLRSTSAAALPPTGGNFPINKWLVRRSYSRLHPLQPSSAPSFTLSPSLAHSRRLPALLLPSSTSASPLAHFSLFAGHSVRSSTSMGATSATRAVVGDERVLRIRVRSFVFLLLLSFERLISRS
jgi:hypothetical protein